MFCPASDLAFTFSRNVSKSSTSRSGLQISKKQLKYTYFVNTKPSGRLNFYCALKARLK